MLEREFFQCEGRTWFVRVREAVRRDEARTHITLELVSDQETHVVTCRIEDWHTAEPDYANLLSRSLAAGASRHVRQRRSPLAD